jgi:hypothetical protein
MSSSSDPWGTHYTDLSNYAGDTVIVALRVVSGTSYTQDAALDDISVAQGISCLPASGLATSSVTYNSFDATWTAGNTAAIGSELRYSTDTTNWTSMAATGTSATVGGLNAATQYVYEVREICAVGDTSAWSNLASATTSCLPAALPLTETFATWAPQCWSINTGSAPWLNYTTGGVSMAEANFWSLNNASYIMESQAVILSTDAKVQYDWSHSGSFAASYPYDSLSIGVRSASDTTWTILLTHSAANNNFATTGAGATSPASTMDQGVVNIPLHLLEIQ